MSAAWGRSGEGGVGGKFFMNCNFRLLASIAFVLVRLFFKALSYNVDIVISNFVFFNT